MKHWEIYKMKELNMNETQWEAYKMKELNMNETQWEARSKQ